MLHEVTGDLLLNSAQTITLGVAPNDPHSQGLALALRERWPTMYRDCRHFCQTTHPKAEDVWACGGTDGARIVSLFTQEAIYNHGAKPGRASAEHLNHAPKALRGWVKREDARSLALPRLATGVGGMRWEEVRPLIDKHLGDLPIPVYLYVTYHKDQAATEPA